MSGIWDPVKILRATLYAKRGLSRSIQSLKVSQASEGCRVRCARAHCTMPAGAMTSSRVSATIARNRSTIGCNAAPTSGSAKAKASAATISRSGSADGTGSPSMTVATLAKVPASRANHPVVSELGACGIIPVTGSLPCVGRMP